MQKRFHTVPALAALLVAAAATSEAASLRPERVAAEPSWKGAQFIQADAQGRVYLLRAETLQVYPVKANGLGEPVALKTQALGHNEGRLDAAMSRSGDWVIRDGNNVRLFRDGKEKQLQALGWPLTAVGMLRGEPLAGVGPFPVGRQPRASSISALPPLVVTWEGDEWSALVSERASDEAVEGTGPAWMQETAVNFAADGDGRLWVANTYRYRVRQFSPAGRELLEIVVGDGKIKHVADAAPLQKRLELEVERTGQADGTKGKISANTAKPAVVAMTEGRDGKMYFLVRSEEKGSDFVLDRFDPVMAKLERSRLALRYPGRMSLAPGKDGLYFAAFNGERGRWRLDWSTLDEAKWQEVEDAKIGTAESTGP